MATAPEKTHPAGSPIPSYPAPAPPAAADVTTELEEFRRYLDKQIAQGIGNVSVDAVLAEFRLFQDELRRLREELREPLERSLRGECFPLDGEALKAEVTRRLAAKGIVDEPGQDRRASVE